MKYENIALRLVNASQDLSIIEGISAVNYRLSTGIITYNGKISFDDQLAEESTNVAQYSEILIRSAVGPLQLKKEASSAPLVQSRMVSKIGSVAVSGAEFSEIDRLVSTCDERFEILFVGRDSANASLAELKKVSYRPVASSFLTMIRRLKLVI